MQASNIPTKFQKIWGASAGGSYIRTIPVASQIGITNGAASFTDGFPPDCFSPVAAGGVPPFGQDFNGILQDVTAWNQWQQAGGPIAYDSTFQSEIGGYPKGCVVSSATTLGTFWMATVDNNTTNPDTGGAGWSKIIGPTGVTAGNYSVPNVAVQADGRITSISTATNIAVPGYITAGANMGVTGSFTITGAGGIQGGWQCEAYGAGNPALVASVGLVAGTYGFTATAGWLYGPSGAASAPSGVTGQFGFSSGLGYVQGLGFAATSDVRLKKNIKPITTEDAFRFIRTVQPVEFDWTTDDSHAQGYIAQQAISAGFSHLVGALPNEKLERAEHEYESGTVTSVEGIQLHMKYNDAQPYYHAAIEGLMKQNAALLARIEALEGRPHA